MQRFKSKSKRSSSSASIDAGAAAAAAAAGAAAPGGHGQPAGHGHAAGHGHERSKVDDKVMEFVMKKDHAKLRQVIGKRKSKAIHSPNAFGQFALIEACKFNSPECVEILMDADSDISTCHDVDGRAATHLVAESGMANVMAVLLRKGANIEAADPRGYTPLHLAAMEGHDVIIQLLLGYSAPIEARDRNGNTPLILACAKGHHNAVERLVSGGASLNATNDRGRTALMCACEVGLTASVRLLVEKGARINPKDADGATARELATVGGHDGCVAALPSSADLGHLASTAAGKGGSGSGHQLVADMAREVQTLRAALGDANAALGAERTAVARLEAETSDLRAQLDALKAMDDAGGGDSADGKDLFDDADDLLDGLDEDNAGKADEIEASLPPDARDLVHKLRRECTTAKFEVVALTEQLHTHGVAPASTSGVAKATELLELRRRCDEHEAHLASLSGDVVPLAIVDKIKSDHKRRVDELQAELAEATAQAVAAAEGTDYEALDALECKVVFYRQLVLAAAAGELPPEVRAEVDRIAAGGGGG